MGDHLGRPQSTTLETAMTLGQAESIKSEFRATLIMALTGCLLSLGCRASPAPDAGYLQDTKLLKPDKAAPFNRFYMNPAYHDKSYSEIYVSPVNTDYMMAENIWEKAALANIDPADVRRNAKLLAE